jgi:hypothetical protein
MQTCLKGQLILLVARYGYTACALWVLPCMCLPVCLLWILDKLMIDSSAWRPPGSCHNARVHQHFGFCRRLVVSFCCSLKDILYKKRMERQLAAARGLGPMGERPPDEDGLGGAGGIPTAGSKARICARLPSFGYHCWAICSECLLSPALRDLFMSVRQSGTEQS